MLLLYRVEIEYEDVSEIAEWERKFNVWLDSKSRAGRSIHDVEGAPRRPERKRYERHVAVFPRFGTGACAEAARLACNAVVGPEDAWEEWGVVVVGCAYVGDVVVERETPTPTEASQ
jgi:hypothetical protein